MAFVAVLGPVASKIFESLTKRPYASNGSFYIVSLFQCFVVELLFIFQFYLLYFIISSSVSIYRSQKSNVVFSEKAVFDEKSQKFVISALGTKLPRKYSVDTHFKQMNTMWK